MKTAEEVSVLPSLLLGLGPTPPTAAAAASPQFHLDYSLTRNEWKRKEQRAGEGRREGACSEAAARRRALTLYELNCSASRKSFIMKEAGPAKMTASGK